MEHLTCYAESKSQLYLDRASLAAQMVTSLPAMQDTVSGSWIGKVPWRREWPPAPELLPGELHGQRSWRAIREATQSGAAAQWMLATVMIVTLLSGTLYLLF